MAFQIHFSVLIQKPLQLIKKSITSAHTLIGAGEGPSASHHNQGGRLWRHHDASGYCQGAEAEGEQTAKGK